MTRVLEFVVALIIVFILAVIVGLFLPSHAHIQRSIDISHNPQHIYDVLNNFRRLDDYAGGELKLRDPNVKFSLSGPAYGKGATFSWQGNEATIGDGKFVNRAGSIDLAGNSSVSWGIDNGWRGENKTFTITVTPSSGHRVSKVIWGYDVDYGWNLVDRYSQLWIHGEPAAMIQYGLDSLQTMMAGIPNIDYGKVFPGLYQVPATPVLLVSTSAPRTVDDIDAAKAAAMKQIQAALDKLGIKAAGPTTTIRTEWGDTTFKFDQAVPIATTTLKIDGKTYDLAKLPPPPTPAELAAAPAEASSAGASALASSTGSDSADKDKSKGPQPGSLDKHNRLVVSANVRAVMRPAHTALAGTWTGESGVEFMVQALQAYADTHGYAFTQSVHHAYNQLASMPTVSSSEQFYRVFLPVQDAPQQTPDQIAGRTTPLKQLNPALWGGESPDADKAESKKAEGK